MIVANKDGIKRKLDLPIELCLNRDELFALATAIDAVIDADNNGQHWVYGWIHIPLNATTVPNTPPLDWKDRAK